MVECVNGRTSSIVVIPMSALFSALIAYYCRYFITHCRNFAVHDGGHWSVGEQNQDRCVLKK